MSYEAFLAEKKPTVAATGPIVEAVDIHPKLFGFQRDLVRWSVRKGRAALFADTGLGKTFMQLEWARLIGGRSLIVAPLSVARQTRAEAGKLGLDVHYTRSGDDLSDGINITNYEMLEHFDPAAFTSVVLDESSILKSLDGKTRSRLIAMFGETPYRLCCTATPAPNDIAELGNHAEFLGVMTHSEMLSAFFVRGADEARRQGWRLKGHAENQFYRWLASWSMSVRKPSDLGYSDEGYLLPPLRIQRALVPTNYRSDGALMFTGLKGIQDRSRVRKATHGARVAKVAELVNGTTDQWIVWCGLNVEAEEAAAAIPGAVNVHGALDPDEKAQALEAFQDGSIRVLVTKPRIAGFGMNFQNAHRMAFLGLSDSWESYYQCIRRCWRFGQREPVDAAIVLADVEEEIHQNVLSKEREAERMADRLLEHVREFERDEIGSGGADVQPYETDEATGEGWTLKLGDSVERLAEVESASVGLSVFSPPFLSLYTYSPSDRDLGNSRNPDQFAEHFAFIVDELLRVTMPGRLCAVHVAQVPSTIVHDGEIGVKDFRGQVIALFSGRGWVYHGEVCIDKDPQAQAIRTKSKGLLFVQMEKDAAWLRPALADYILLFRKPGENPEPVKPEMSREEWIAWARPVWYGIRESDTLNAAEGREEKDEKHIAPLQLGTIERCIRLWSNHGDLVLSPFAGIGSEGYVAVQKGRQFVGIELKPSYWRAGVRNLRRAQELKEGQLDLGM